MSRFPKALRESSLLKTIGGTMAIAAEGIKNATAAIDRAAGRPHGMFEFGRPLGDAATMSARATAVAQAVGGNGFRLYQPRRVKTVNGQTRSQRKEAARLRAYTAQQTEAADISRARDLGLIGLRTVEPYKVAALLQKHDSAAAQPAADKPKRTRTKKSAE
jgi:hypothetical protein